MCNVLLPYGWIALKRFLCTSDAISTNAICIFYIMVWQLITSISIILIISFIQLSYWGRSKKHTLQSLLMKHRMWFFYCAKAATWSFYENSVLFSQRPVPLYFLQITKYVFTANFGADFFFKLTNFGPNWPATLQKRPLQQIFTLNASHVRAG